MKRIFSISIFPQIFEALNYGIPNRAKNNGLEIHSINLRDFSKNKHNKVDDTSFGSDYGMVMMPDVLERAYLDIKNKYQNIKCIVPDPQGKKFTQKDAKILSLEENIVFVCGRYEGIDQRWLDNTPHESFSLGDYVLSGGELASCVMIDAIIREMDGMVGNSLSIQDDSFQNNLLDFPHYTRPWDWQSIFPPAILRTGHHKNIAKWRKIQSIGRTWVFRPDLIIGRVLTYNDLENLKSYIEQMGDNE